MTARSVAILVGIDQFNDAAFTPLRFCQSDVEGMARVLGNRELCGFEVTQLRNKSRDEILEHLDRTVQSLVPGDKLLFYFAVHGRRSPKSGRLFLVAANTKSDALRATGILIDDALDIIRESRCTNRALVLDCCHSGAIGAAFRGGDIASELSDLARNSGTYILTASTAIELAEERESAVRDGTSGNGVFTKYFIEAIETGNASNNDAGDITIDAIYDYIQQRVSVNALQKPQRFVIGGAGSFIVGHSSAALWERRRVELLKHFRELNKQYIISDDDYVTAAKLFRTPWSAFTSDQKLGARKSLEVFDRKIPISQFLSQLAPNKGESRQPDEWKAEFIKRSWAHFLIRLRCSDASHKMELKARPWHIVEQLKLDDVPIENFILTGKKVVSFRISSHPAQFLVQFASNSLQRIWDIQLAADDKIILSSHAFAQKNLRRPW
jgi:hypothetical protein